MKREEHNEITKKLYAMVTPENQASASELLTQLTNDYEETTTKMETASAEHEKLKNNFEHLRQVNADLFLKVGVSHNTPENVTENNDNIEEIENDIKIEDLFNEKGELK